MTFNYWLRSALGIENIVLRELEQKLPVSASESAHRSLFVSLPEQGAEAAEVNLKALLGLATADDVYKYLGSFHGADKTKAGAEELRLYFRKAIIPKLLEIYKPEAKYIRITLSFLGKRNYSRFFVEEALNELLAYETRYEVLSNDHADPFTPGELRLRIHIEGDTAHFGLGLQDKPLHRRPWRTESYAAQLHPPLAAAMALIARPAFSVIDPFCGSGTILIEAAAQFSGLSYTGYDTDAEAVNAAAANAAATGTVLNLHQTDFHEVYQTAGDYFIISNPPWGEKHEISEEDESIFIKKLADILNASKGCIVLIPEGMLAGLTAAGVPLKSFMQTRVRGIMVHLAGFNCGGLL
ncbi:MAG: methyltransferase [Bacteroidota bacterium]